MKRLIIFIFLFPVSWSIQAQETFNYCATALELCDFAHLPPSPVVYNNPAIPITTMNTITIPLVFDSNLPSPNSVCQGNKTRIFLKFRCWTGGTTNTNAGNGLFYTAQNQTGTSVQTKLKIHGPFNDGENYCDLINGFQSPVVYDQTAASPNQEPITTNLQSGKIYYFEFLIDDCQGTLDFQIAFRLLTCTSEPPCQDCIPTFMPTVGDYVISAWVRELDPAAGTTTYATPNIEVSDGAGVIDNFYGSGEIIDGWQKIEGQFAFANPSLFKVELIGGTKETLFDDIRVYPNDGSAITYVYDPITYRLMAELDERNYATLYEYDEEGKLIRIKKETEKGIMTIQENRENNSLDNGQ